MNAPGVSAVFQQQQSRSSGDAASNGSGSQSQRLKVEDALQYLEEVKQMYGGRPKVYNDFLDIMKEFKSQHLDTCGVITRVAKLFHGKPKLICGFNSFLPNGFRIEIAEEEEEQHQIRLRMPNDEIKIIMTEDGTLVDPKQISGIVTPGKGRLPVSQLMAHAPSSSSVMLGVSPKSPHGLPSSLRPGDQDSVIMYSMVSGSDTLNQPTYVRLKHPLAGGGGESGGSFIQQHDSNMALSNDYNAAMQINKLSSSYNLLQQPPTGGGVSPATNVEESDAGKFPNSLFDGMSPNAAAGVQRGGGQPFESAIHYVNKIKRRFENDPAIYKRFLDILQQYQGNAKHPAGDNREPIEQRVYREVAALFRHHPDLLEEFTTFMPETAQHHRHAMLVEREKLGKRKYTRRKDRLDMSGKQQRNVDSSKTDNKDSVRSLGQDDNSIQANRADADESDWQTTTSSSPSRKMEKVNSSGSVRGARGGGRGTPSLISSGGGPGSRGGGRGGGNNRRKLIGTAVNQQQTEPSQPVGGVRSGRRARGKTVTFDKGGFSGASSSRSGMQEPGGRAAQISMQRNDSHVADDNVMYEAERADVAGKRRLKRGGGAEQEHDDNDDDNNEAADIMPIPAAAAASTTVPPQKKKPKLVKTSFRVKKFVNKNILSGVAGGSKEEAECSFEPFSACTMPSTLAAATNVLGDETFQLYAFIRRCRRVMPPALAQALFKLMELYVARFCDLEFFLDNASQLMVKSYPKLYDQLVRCCERLRSGSSSIRSLATTAPAAHTVELNRVTTQSGSFLSSVMGNNKLHKLGATLAKGGGVQSLDPPGTFGFWTDGAAADRTSGTAAGAVGVTSFADNLEVDAEVTKNELLSRSMDKKRALFSITATNVDRNELRGGSGPSSAEPHQRGVPVRRSAGVVGSHTAPATSLDGLEAKLMLDPSELKQFGPSYRVLPDDFPNLKCSGRAKDARLKDILNDRYVSCPVYLEGSGFVISKKNPSEDLLFRVEDERYEMDMLISGAEYAIRDMKWLQERMKCMKPSVLEQFRWQQANNHRRIVMLLYGDNGPLIIRSLTEDPQITTPMVLKRLEDKWSDWLKMRNEMQDLWGEQERRNWARALDYTGQAFKAADARRLKSRVLVNEIEKAYEQHQQTAETTAFPPSSSGKPGSVNDESSVSPNELVVNGSAAGSKSAHFELKYRNDEFGLALADDVLFLLQHELERYNFTKKEKRVLKSFLVEIHYRMFGYKPSDVPAHDVLSARIGGGGGDAAAGNAPLAHLEELAQMLLPPDGMAYSAASDTTTAAKGLGGDGGDSAGAAASPNASESTADSSANTADTDKKVTEGTSRPGSARRNAGASYMRKYNTADNNNNENDDENEILSGGAGSIGNNNGRRNGGADELRFGPLSDSSSSKQCSAVSLSLLGAGGGVGGVMGTSGGGGYGGLVGLGAGAELEDLPLHERLPDYHYHSLNRIRTRSDPMLPLPWIELQSIMQDIMPTMNMFELELSDTAIQRAKYRSRLLAHLRWLTLTKQPLPCFDAARARTHQQQLTLCGGNHLYALMRYHHILTERLNILYTRVVRVFEENNNGDAALLAAAVSTTTSGSGSGASTSLRNDVARLCRVRKPLHPTLYWCVFMDRLMKYTDGNVDVPQFEDDMREMFLDKCQYAFSLALIISYAVKQLHMLYVSESGKKIIEHFGKLHQQRAAPSSMAEENDAAVDDDAAADEKSAAEQERVAYVTKVQEIMQDNNCYCITSCNNGSKLEVCLLEAAHVPEEGAAAIKASTWEDAVSLFLDPNAVVAGGGGAEKKNTSAVNTTVSSTLASVKATQPLFLVSTHAEWGRSKKSRFSDNDNDNDAGDGDSGTLGGNTANDEGEQVGGGGGGADNNEEDEDDDDDESSTPATAGVQATLSSKNAVTGTNGDNGESPSKSVSAQADAGVQLKTIKVMRTSIHTPLGDGQSLSAVIAETLQQTEKAADDETEANEQQVIVTDDDGDAVISKPRLFVQSARSSRVTQAQLQRREIQDRSATFKRFVASVWMPKAELIRDSDRAFQSKMQEGLTRNKHGSNSEPPYFPYLVHRQKDSEQRDGMHPSWVLDSSFDHDADVDVDENIEERQQQQSSSDGDESNLLEQQRSRASKAAKPPRGARRISTHSASHMPRFKRIASPGAEISLPFVAASARARKAGLISAATRRVLPIAATSSMTMEVADEFVSPFKRPLSRDVAAGGVQQQSTRDDRNVVLDDATTPPGAPAALMAPGTPPPLASFSSEPAEDDDDEQGASMGSVTRRGRRISSNGNGSGARGDFEDATRREASVTSPLSASADETSRLSVKPLSSTTISKDAVVSTHTAAQR